MFLEYNFEFFIVLIRQTCPIKLCHTKSINVGKKHKQFENCIKNISWHKNSKTFKKS